MKLCLFASYTYKRKSIRVFRRPILVYLDVCGVEIPLLSTVSISNCSYQEAPGEVVWSGCSLFGIHSNILGSSLLVFLCRALIASFLSRSSLTWLCLQTINFRAALSLFLSWASNPYHTMYKTLRKLPAQVSWKTKFKCQICPSCLSWVSCLSWWPWWPWKAWLQW